MEIMVVVAIIGMIAAMGLPSLYRMVHREGFTRDVTDFMELCSMARAQAILQGNTAELVFHPKDRRCQLMGPAASEVKALTAGRSFSSVQFGDDVTIEMLDVGLLEYKDVQEVHVRFFPDGTSDEMTLILRYDGNAKKIEWRKISLEITTGLASVDSDPHHWR